MLSLIVGALVSGIAIAIVVSAVIRAVEEYEENAFFGRLSKEEFEIKYLKGRVPLDIDSQ
jgi:hypothetical protein